MEIQTRLPRNPELIPPTQEDLDQIRERCRKATPGGWMAIRENDVFGTLGGPVCRMDEDEEIVVGQAGDFGSTNRPIDDALFLAHARTDVPRLLNEVCRLRVELEMTQAQLRVLRESGR